MLEEAPPPTPKPVRVRRRPAGPGRPAPANPAVAPAALLSPAVPSSLFRAARCTFAASTPSGRDAALATLRRLMDVVSGEYFEAGFFVSVMGNYSQFLGWEGTVCVCVPKRPRAAKVKLAKLLLRSGFKVTQVGAGRECIGVTVNLVPQSARQAPRNGAVQ